MNVFISTVTLCALLTGAQQWRPAKSQQVTFDFDNAPVHSPLPISLTVGGITAQFSATGEGFSVQRADALGFAPPGFAGYCLYPSSVFASDLLVSFSRELTNFSILYSPEEYGCDSSATLRVTAYLNDLVVGTSTTNASAPGTWPSEILRFSSVQSFNKVVVHYDARPACQDYGPIFMADNMVVEPAAEIPIAPTLQISILNDLVQLWWPTNAIGFELKESQNLSSPWNPITTQPEVVGTDNVVVLPISPTAAFYQLKHP